MMDNNIGSYYITTFGCQMNVRDSQTAAGVLESLGYQRADTMENASLILFNTCCIRDMAERKAYGAIGTTRILKERNPDIIIGVFGCMTQGSYEANNLLKRMPHVDFSFGTHNLHRLPVYIQNAKEQRDWEYLEGDVPSEFSLPSIPNRFPNAFINITHGCDNYCSYCIVPYVRGREISTPLEWIKKETEHLLNMGYQEITLLGQNVNSYGRDVGRHSFADVLQELNRMGVPRIRFMTSHPKDLTDEIVETMKNCPNIMSHIHLPVQSGSNRILAWMNRKYTMEQYLSLIAKLRSAMPDIGITTDIIVGFPGESDADFLDTLSLVKCVRFDAAFTFKFSPRKGTAAADRKDIVSEEEKTYRIEALLSLLKEHTMQLHQAMVGKVYDVLIEGSSTRNAQHLAGRSERGKTINFQNTGESIGDIVPVKVIRAHANTLFGERK